ncbi:glycoside hydrolase family 10 protein [Marinifilum sp. D737]|uniref:glycoside hydrolase family 10 protein n=1 Tax=Marinifilum sp. D737 TaxID=2969628 RepID=UPI00227289DC|nr:family 10 glycosylhydrolase [Marinifilum sp. D737]MCY1634583.1 family 10 glycosylhydrolase [Marinifilum sp. D737]
MKKIIAISILILMSLVVFAKKKSPKREMRAVWIATVDNIDWPSKPGLSVEEQRKELIAHLDQHKKNGMNTVIFQVRPATDAFYKSAYEPWSQWLTGEQGKAPEPFYDPLQFAVEECHKRAMELHAWMNPYRAVFLYKDAKTDPNHITNTRPELFLTYGKHKYFNPGLPETRDYVSKIVGDVVRRYDVDAIHFDDYFYPYKIKDEAFPDSESFVKHGGEFYPDRIDDWRRENVNLVIKQINDTIKSIKPWMPFGISPFGVWRNKNVDKSGSRTQAGQTNYDDLYADVLLWLKNDWIDYVAPQIYWHIGKKVANYKVIAKWWNKNSYGKPCYVGQGAYRLDSESRVKAWHNSDEIIRQLELNRKLKQISGSMFFSSKSFTNNLLGINEKLQSQIYQNTTLIPECNTIAPIVLPAPANLLLRNGKLEWESVKDAKCYVVYAFDKNERVRLDKVDSILSITARPYLNLKYGLENYKYVVTAISRTNAESEASQVLNL